MTEFWPFGVNVNDVVAPTTILHSARREWESTSGGLLTLVIQSAADEDGYDMSVVHARHAESTKMVTLFSVVSRSGSPYPVRIVPRDDEIPTFFLKSYKSTPLNMLHGLPDLSGILEAQERTVENPWVADTPLEFRRKLKEVFNLSSVKSQVLNLLASHGGQNDVNEQADTGADASIEPTQDSSAKEEEKKW
jgi:hypothetical protein